MPGTDDLLLDAVGEVVERLLDHVLVVIESTVAVPGDRRDLVLFQFYLRGTESSTSESRWDTELLRPPHCKTSLLVNADWSVVIDNVRSDPVAVHSIPRYRGRHLYLAVSYVDGDGHVRLDDGHDLFRRRHIIVHRVWARADGGEVDRSDFRLSRILVDNGVEAVVGCEVDVGDLVRVKLPSLEVKLFCFSQT